MESEFKEVTLWKHDDVPPPDHAIQGVKEWLEVAKAVSRRTHLCSNVNKWKSL